MLNDLSFCRTNSYLGINLTPFFIFGIYEIPLRVKRTMWQTMGILIMKKKFCILGLYDTKQCCFFSYDSSLNFCASFPINNLYYLWFIWYFMAERSESLGNRTWRTMLYPMGNVSGTHISEVICIYDHFPNVSLY